MKRSIISLGHYQYGEHHDFIWGGDLYEVNLSNRVVFVRRLTCWPDQNLDENFNPHQWSLQDSFSVIDGKERLTCLENLWSWAGDESRRHYFGCVARAVRLSLMKDKE